MICLSYKVDASVEFLEKQVVCLTAFKQGYQLEAATNTEDLVIDFCSLTY